MVSDDRLISLIDSIYESAVKPDTWIQSIRAIADALDGASSVLVLLDESGLQARLSAADRLDPADMVVYADYYADKDLTLQALSRMPVGNAFTVPMIIPVERYHSSEHFNDFLAPQDIHHIVFTQFMRDDTASLF